MTKQNIIIKGYEDSEDGSRTIFITNKGKMSAWADKGELVTQLKQNTEKDIEVEIYKSEKKNKAGYNYLNITQFYGIAHEPTPEERAEQKEVQRNYEATHTGSGRGGGTMITPVQKPQDLEKPIAGIDDKGFIGIPKEHDYKPSYYVSYAKDICIQLIQDKIARPMEKAIILVKQAHREFS